MAPDPIDGQRVLVTGGGGSIGSHLAAGLVEANDVLGIDDADQLAVGPGVAVVQRPGLVRLAGGILGNDVDVGVVGGRQRPEFGAGFGVVRLRDDVQREAVGG